MDGTLAPNQYDQITIQNLDTVPFEVIYNGHLYKKMAAGEIVRLPRFLADHALKHLVDQILNHLDIPLNNFEKRKQWAAKIVLGEEVYEQPVLLSPNERMQKEVDAMNGSGLDEILKSKKRASDVPDDDGMLPEIDENQLDHLPADPPPAPLPSLDQPAPQPTPQPEPIVVAPQPPVPAPTPTIPTPQVQATPAPTPQFPPTVTTPPVTPAAPDPELVAHDNQVKVPTRQDLYNFARDVMKMDLNDPKTMSTLENLSVPDLAKELQYSEQNGL